MIKITIETENSAFQDENKNLEISRILSDLSRAYADNLNVNNLYDINGNKVGNIQEVTK
jgi:hypothetical protein